MVGEPVVRVRAALPAPPPVGWTQRLLLIAVGLALVLMHHLVGAHQHTPSMPGPAALSAVTGHGHDPAAVGAPSPAAALHVHHEDGGHDMAAMLHDCLAVLAAAAALALVLWLLRGVHLAQDGPPAGAATVRPRTSRPPAPVPVLLAQLQVLRL